MKYLLLFILLCVLDVAQSQLSDSTSRIQIDQSNTILADIQLRQTNFNKTAMISLNSWAVGNIAYGTIANFQTTGEAKYFHQMNAIWNVVNLGIGIPGIIGAYKDRSQMTFEELYKTQKRMETIYLFNAGLDVAYITAGVASRLYANQLTGTNYYRFKGYGSSLIMQGGYLFLHDLAMYILLKTNTTLFDHQWRQVKLTYTGTSIRLKF